MTAQDDISAVRFLPCGDTALSVEFGDRIDRRMNARVLALADAVEKSNIPGIIEMVPTFRSLMVHYDPCLIRFTNLKSRIEPLLTRSSTIGDAGRLWSLPACYEGDFGPDLDEVADRTSLTRRHVIEMHSSQTFHVYMIGFLPGFPYMGDLPEALSLPRLKNPRLKVPKGSVCIASTMTAIYTHECPGGWHLLGRTPFRIFDPRIEKPVLLAPGDKVQFRPISRAEFETLDAQSEAGALAIKPETLPS